MTPFPEADAKSDLVRIDRIIPALSVIRTDASYLLDEELKNFTVDSLDELVRTLSDARMQKHRLVEHPYQMD